METSMKSHIRKWYRDNYPDDDIWGYIDPNITFEGILRRMNKRQDIYCKLADDSAVRERVFAKLAKMMGVSYDAVYDLWKV